MPRAARTHAADAPRATAARLRLLVLACVAVALAALPGAALANGSLLALNDDAPQPLPALNDGPAPDALVEDDSDAGFDDEWLDDEFDLDDEFAEMASDDPLEPVNRGVFAFNRQVDRFMLTPVTDVYQTLVPTVGREGVNNVFLNLDSPVRMTNAMLQGRPKASGIALARFLVNTTFGIGGLFDVGSRVGLKKQRADFGQTLATWGTPQGPYLVFPFLGPMTLRHGVGMGVDFVMQPVSYVVGPLPGMIVGAGKDFSRREQAVFELESLKDTSLDFYAALRSAFLQDRADMITAGAEDSSIETMADAGSDPALASLTPEEREARCLAHPRSRRELAKPSLRSHVRNRCAAAARALLAAPKTRAEQLPTPYDHQARRPATRMQRQCVGRRVMLARTNPGFEGACPMVKYNPFSDEVMRDPYPIYAQLRAEAPVYYIEEFDAWAFSKFQDIWDCSKDNKHFTATKGTTSAHVLTKVQPVTPMLNMMDPPDHTKLRSEMRQFFTPAKVAPLEPFIREMVQRFIAEAKERGSMDVMGDYSANVATAVACKVNGIPQEDGEMLNQLVWRFFARDPEIEGMTPDGLAAMEEMGGYFYQLAAGVRAKGAGGDDVLNLLCSFELNGEQFDLETIASHLILLIIGGAETFPKTFANATQLLAEHPDQRAKVAADPSLVPDAFQESLRYWMPTQFLCRTITNEFEIRGQKLKPGQPVLFLYPSANRDEDEFDDPDVFDIDRKAQRILSFGAGTHACIGMHAAKLEAKVCLEEMLKAFPEYELDLDNAEKLVTDFVQGYASFPIKL